MKRNEGKLLVLVPVAWLVALLFFGLNEMSDKPSGDNAPSELQMHQHRAKIRELEEQNKHLIIEAALRHDAAKRMALEIEQAHHGDHNHDHDHPEEERKKAQDQQNMQARPIQVHAPQQLDEAANPNSPGELGKPVIIDRNELSPSERLKYDQGWEDHAFNQYASDMISLHRSLADIRDPACKAVKWYSPLPTTSVIIIFHNEAWSALLRTISSVLDRSAPQLIKEIIVVDDFSDFPHLGDPLKEYLAKIKKVRLIRMEKRVGLIMAKIRGASVATGDVLIFLDSHCEVTEGWLEPLLDPIARNANVSTIPVIEVIDDNTFEMHGTPIEAIQVGGFDWYLLFDWRLVPRSELERRKQRTDPIRTPTMAGGLFAINRKYFETLGGYDPGMEIWGGENLEVSFKLWMCGGELVCAPCSHVGHIFRERSPYKWPTEVNVIRKNAVRLAEVWLDAYKYIFYERILFDLGDYGNVSDRVALRQKLQCKSFDWFLKNVYPDQYVPGESVYYGEIRSQYNQSAVCMDSNADSNGQIIISFMCHGQGGNQYWMMSKQNEIRRDLSCLDYAGGRAQLGIKEKLTMQKCHGKRGNQLWFYENSMIKHSSGFCVEVSQDEQSVFMSTCNTHNTRQFWSWTKKDNATMLLH